MTKTDLDDWKEPVACIAARGVPFAAFREYKPLTRVSPTTQPPPWFVMSPHGGRMASVSIP